MPMHTSSDHAMQLGEREFSFGSFRFIPARQLLVHGETPLRLGGRALDILKVLVERPGELVSKKELIAQAWPNSVVEESNVKVHIAALRRVLEEGNQDLPYIATVSGRGYRFVAPVSCKIGEVPRAQEQIASGQMHNLPAPATRMIGRAATVATLMQKLEQHRFVSIVGTGGIGKTTVVLSIAEAFNARTGMEVCFVDLSPLPDARFVAGALAAALGLPLHSGDGVQALIASLRERRLLLVLDSCEHVIETTAVLVERIVSGAPDVLVLATSREPLRAPGECVHRLAPLEYPSAEIGTSALQALEFPAVQLFVERASECLEGYQLTDADAPAVAEICRRLEGIALAIELAAMRIDAFGARELAARLDDRFRLLKRGRRSAQQRHSTLAAALDWSYECLPDDERALLRALSVFAGTFTLDSAIGLCAVSPADPAMLVDAVANLVAKSMLSADVSGPLVYYRLLETTKAYALDKLDQSGEMDAMRRRYAEFQRATFERAAIEWGKRPDPDWLASYGRSLDDVRSALAWAFSPDGDVAIGISLTVHAIPLWMHLSLLEECRQCVERALSGERPCARDEMQLHAALAAAILYTHGPVDETNVSWTRALELADELEDGEYQLRSLWGMAVYRSYAGDHRAVLMLAERVRAIAGSTGDLTMLASLDRLIATALHYGGDQSAARSQLEQMLSRHVAPKQRSTIARFQLDQHSAALGTLANVLWLQGYPDQAMQTAYAALQEARDADHAPSLLNALAHVAFPVTLYVGDYAAAEGLLNELSDYLAKRSFTLWNSLLRCLRAVLQVRRGDMSSLPLLHDALDELRCAGFHLRVSSYLGTLAEALGAHGWPDEGLAVIGAALSSCEAGEERWCHAELLRIKGGLLEAGDAVAAEQLYRQALDVAGRHGALAWELRAARSLAQLKARVGAADEGRNLLLTVYNNFSEGFATSDLRQARALLDGTVEKKPRP
jgi:predicted ATPase/DNA-binding winged helix-turn-helix (wHTH) protein